MKKFKKILSAVSAAVLCAVPIVNVASINASGSPQMKTYVVYSVATRPDIAYFDFRLNYGNDKEAEKSIPTSLLSKGFFSSIQKSSYNQNTYNGPSIGKTGKIASTKCIVSMNTESIYDNLYYSNVVIRNANGVTLSPTSITIGEEVLLGDVDQNGVVNTEDADLITRYLTNKNMCPPISEKGLDAADVDSRGDGINSNDAYTIQLYVAGIISHF